MKADPRRPFRPGDIARGDRIRLDWHGREIEGEVYEATAVAVHFRWVAAGPDFGRDGACGYEQIREVIEP